MADGRFLAALLLALLVATAGGGERPDPLTPGALAEWLAQADPPLVLDVRGTEAYRAGTVPGALDAGRDAAGFTPDGRGGAVVLIAGASDALPGWRARLTAAGHAVYLLQGGMVAWRDAGLPLEFGTRYVRPGTVPFVIPRGLCEMNEPAQVFE